MLNFDDAASTFPWVENPRVNDLWGEELSTAQAAQIQGGARRPPATSDLTQSLGIGITGVSTTSNQRRTAPAFDPTVLLSIFSAIGNFGSAGTGNQSGRNQNAGLGGLGLGGF